MVRFLIAILTSLVLAPAFAEEVSIYRVRNLLNGTERCEQHVRDGMTRVVSECQTNRWLSTVKGSMDGKTEVAMSPDGIISSMGFSVAPRDLLPGMKAYGLSVTTVNGKTAELEFSLSARREGPYTVVEIVSAGGALVSVCGYTTDYDNPEWVDSIIQDGRKKLSHESAIRMLFVHR
ncbi:MAG: hypothetical protein WC444_01515 [Candidatus Paceibacterota bacterium]